MFHRLRKRSAATTTIDTTPTTVIPSQEASTPDTNKPNTNMDHAAATSGGSSEETPLVSTTNDKGNNGPLPPTTTQHDNNNQQQHNKTVLNATTGIPASFYVLSGVTQPLLMTLCKDAGLADPNCQLYMLFYYLGPASVGFKLWWNQHNEECMPSWKMILRAGLITLFDITAQAMNYTGAALAGPTIFAIVYSSVTVWTAVFSRLVLQRKLIPGQWMGIWIVFGGLAITATDHSVQVGSDVAHGLLLVIFGSAMHGLTYVLCEVVMVIQEEAFANMPPIVQLVLGDKQEQRLTVVQNCAIQGFLAVLFMLMWQIMYTVPHFDHLILEPAQQAGTTLWIAGIILGLFALANLIHALSYFFTLRHFPGGATSAGVMKGLQAVLVFVVTHIFFCGKTGGTEMCFTPTKFMSLVTVVGGVLLFGFFTEQQHRFQSNKSDSRQHPTKQSINV